MTPVGKRGEIRPCRILATTILLLAPTALLAADTEYRSRVDADPRPRGLLGFRKARLGSFRRLASAGRPA